MVDGPLMHIRFTEPITSLFGRVTSQLLNQIINYVAVNKSST
jgi:hypothetical protein